MREKLKKLKERLDKRMLQKTGKQIIWYIVVFYTIFFIGFILMLLNLDGNSIIVCLLGVLYYICMLVVVGYLGYHQFLASLRDAERRKQELFKNGIRLNVLPVTLDAYKEIGNSIQVIIAKEQKSSFYFTFTDSTEYRTFVDKMIENNEIALTAELIDDKICISIFCNGEIYYPEELKRSNFRWFRANFSVIK